MREMHKRMANTGERPPFLEERYLSRHNLDRESRRLVGLGYRVQSRQDMREADGYHVRFVYMGESNSHEFTPAGTGQRNRL
jgi:hypothetical protein